MHCVSRRSLPALALLLLGLGLIAPAMAQDAGQSDLPKQFDAEQDALSLAVVDSRTAAVEQLANLNEDAKKALKGLYQEAIDFLKNAAEKQKQGDEFGQLSESAPTLLANIRAELSKPPEDPDVNAPADATLAQLETLQSRAVSDLKVQRDQLDSLKTEASKRSQRRSAITANIAKIDQQLKTIEQELQAPTAEPSTPLGLATRTRLLAQRKAKLAETRAAEAEMASYDARRELLPARIDLGQRRVSEHEKRVAAWQDLVSQQRRADAERAQQETEALRQKAAETPQLKPVTIRIKALADLRSNADGITQQLTQLEQKLTDKNQRFEDLRQRFRSARRKVQAAGLTNAMGLFLRKQYENLPQVQKLTQENRARRDIISNIQYQTILFEEERSDFGDVERLVKDTLDSVTEPKSADELKTLEDVSRELFKSRRKLLDAVIQDHDRTFSRLLELNTVNQRLIQTTLDYQNYIEEHILWVRSVNGPLLPSVKDSGEAIRWLINPESWQATFRKMPAAHRKNWLESLVALALLLLSVLLASLSKRSLAELAERVEQGPSDRFRDTLLAIILTAFMAAPLLVLLKALVFSLSLPTQPSANVRVFYQSLNGIAWPLFALEFLRHGFHPKGLATKHWLCPEDSSRALSWSLLWFTPAWLLLSLMVDITDLQNQNQLWTDSLGRLTFALAQLVLAVFLYNTIRPDSAVMAPILSGDTDLWAQRLRASAATLIIACPVVLILLSLRGYHYTATRLEVRVLSTFIFGLSLLSVNALYLRWLRVAARRVLLQQQNVNEGQNVVIHVPAEVTASASAELLATTDPAQGQLFPDQPSDAPVTSGPTENISAPKVAEADSGEATEKPIPDDPEAPEAARTTEAPATVVVSNSDQNADTPPTTINLADIHSQAKDLLRSFTWIALMIGLSSIWYSALPALKKLNKVQIYPSIRVLDDQAPEKPAKASEKKNSGSQAPSNPDPKAAAVSNNEASNTNASANEDQIITLAQLLLAIVIFASTFIIAKNMPALVDMVLLQQLPVDSGGRYAITALSSYLIYLVGFSMALGTLGISWQSVQWLAAALTFGLAFGLQEIFANFVSGLILLFERPIRVGDIVTVGDVSGVVTRIQIRATTVRNFDRKEMIIPNKNFVTASVLNWGLTDSILRAVMPIGIAYGSDVMKAQKILMAAAKDHPNVLTKPAPKAYFLSYGDSTLNLELRVFVPEIGVLATTRQELLVTIGKRFLEENIEIAFPQRDIHIRSVDSLRELLKAPPASPESQLESD